MASVQQEVEALQRMAAFDREADKTHKVAVEAAMCDVCLQRVRLRKNGTLYKHDGGWKNSPCSGTGTRPSVLLGKCPECSNKLSIRCPEGSIHFEMPEHPAGYTYRRLTGEYVCPTTGLKGLWNPPLKVIVI